MAPAAEAAVPPAESVVADVALRPYDLPGARQVLVSGLQLASAANLELRRASIYIGLLSLGLIGPTLIFGLAVVAHYHLDLANLSQLTRSNPSAAASLIALIVMAYAAGIGWIAVTIDGQLIAVSVLAARAGERALTLREATTRARQVFWRVIRGSFIVGILNVVIRAVVGFVVGGSASASQGAQILELVIGAIVLAPFGYLVTGIVLGDVGTIESLRRSVRLTRARPTIALVVALFTLLTAAIQVFALSAGEEVLSGIAGFFHLGLTAGGIALVATVIGLLAFVMALGSLIVTVAAIVSAPQVAAFLGLTFYSGGLDQARDGATQGRRFRWVTRPMAALMIILAIAAVAQTVSLGS